MSRAGQVREGVEFAHITIAECYAFAVPPPPGLWSCTAASSTGGPSGWRSVCLRRGQPPPRPPPPHPHPPPPLQQLPCIKPPPPHPPLHLWQLPCIKPPPLHPHLPPRQHQPPPRVPHQGQGMSTWPMSVSTGVGRGWGGDFAQRVVGGKPRVCLCEHSVLAHNSVPAHMHAHMFTCFMCWAGCAVCTIVPTLDVSPDMGLRQLVHSFEAAGPQV